MTLAIAAPGLLLSAVLALFLALAAATAHPMWRWEPLNLSEAAALRDAGEVARLLDEGRDPNRAYVVRAGLLSEQPLELTPMQAAEVTPSQTTLHRSYRFHIASPRAYNVGE